MSNKPGCGEHDHRLVDGDHGRDEHARDTPVRQSEQRLRLDPKDNVRRDRDTPRPISIERELLAKNAVLAADNRRRLDASAITVLNLIGAPGSGKTALLEATILRLAGAVSMAVLEGDQATDRDAQRIACTGCPVAQINTGSGCHLDAGMIAEGLRAVKPAASTVVFVENVGNLACPALFDLGERMKVVVVSVAEGDDKPLKYPHVFGAADLFVLTKTDLLPYAPFDSVKCFEYARNVNPTIRCIALSAKTGVGLDVWCDFVRGEAARLGGAA
jgi:hydrogenase nickel incorporation protein HypB